MAKYKDQELEQPRSDRGPHPDYEVNLKTATNFIEKVQRFLPEGMKVYLSGSQWLENSLLVVCYIPPKNVPLGNYANSVFLHQSKLEFSISIEKIFNYYMKKCKTEWSKYGS